MWFISGFQDRLCSKCGVLFFSSIKSEQRVCCDSYCDVNKEKYFCYQLQDDICCKSISLHGLTPRKVITLFEISLVNFKNGWWEFVIKKSINSVSGPWNITFKINSFWCKKWDKIYSLISYITKSHISRFWTASIVDPTFLNVFRRGCSQQCWN
jgi:hypothetical protein